MALLHRMRSSAVRRLAAATIAVTAAVLAVAGTLTPALAANGPTMTLDGGDVTIAVQGPDNSLLFYWAVNGTSIWHTVTVAGAGTTFSAPSMAIDGNTVIIAAQGPNQSLMFYWAVNGSPTWHPETIAGQVTTFSAPSLATDGHSIDIAAQGPGGTMYSYYQVNGASTWTPEVVLGDLGVSEAPAVVMAGGLVNIAYQFNSYFLGFASQPIGGATDTWKAWTLGPGEFSPSITATGNAINISAADLNGGVDFYWAFTGSVLWTREAVVATGVYGTTSIAVDSRTNAAIIAATGYNGQLAFFSAVYGTGSWQSELVSGANTVASGPAPVIIPDSVNGYNDVDISAFAPGGQLRFDFSAFRSGTWYGEAVPGNGSVGRL